MLPAREFLVWWEPEDVCGFQPVSSPLAVGMVGGASSKLWPNHYLITLSYLQASSLLPLSSATSLCGSKPTPAGPQTSSPPGKDHRSDNISEVHFSGRKARTCPPTTVSSSQLMKRSLVTMSCYYCEGCVSIYLLSRFTYLHIKWWWSGRWKEYGYTPLIIWIEFMPLGWGVTSILSSVDWNKFWTRQY